jgi:S-formylglutathione hydrolase FrmB
MKLVKLFIACVITLVIALGTVLTAQVQTIVPDPVPGAKPVAVEHIKVHSSAMEGNLEGEAVDRDVIVFLPPSYNTDKHRRYPVVYALHGYFIGAEQWTHEIHVPQTVEGAIAKGAQEMIVVLPDSKTIYNGSMYSSSVTAGDFERFIYHDVVAYVDEHYRTIPERTSRGLVGHSMGGYGASRIGMKHSDVFGALYIMTKRRLPRPSLQQIWQRNRRASPPRNLQQRPRGLPTRRTHPCISICQQRMEFRYRRFRRNSPPMRPWSLSTSTSEI